MTTELQPAPLPTPDDGIDLMEIVTIFVVEWRRFLLAVLLVFGVGVAYIFSIPPLYETDATLLPQGQGQSAVATLFSNHSPGDIFLGLLASRSVQDEVIDRAGLLDNYHTTSRAVARAILGGRSVFSIGRDTLVTIKVRDGNAEAAQRITNAYLEGLESQREKMLDAEALLHNRFFQQQLTQEAAALAQSEQELKAVQQRTGLVQPEAQTSIGLNAIAGVRAQITALEVQLSSLLLGASEQNPQVKDLRAQIGQLQAQEHTMESAGATTAAGAAASAKQMPELNLDYTRKLREVRYHEAIFTSISNQYEAARLSEGYTGTPFVVIDRAIVPEGRAYPNRRLYVMVAAAFSVLVGFAFITLLLVWRKLWADPAQRQRFLTMRRSFRLSRKPL